jgi:hypothetical protein
MTPAVIADSDGDESEAGSCHHFPPPAAPLEESSAGTNHPSGSTDPTFFKSVYDEQRDAAEKYVTHQQVPGPEGEIKDASSFDNGFQETRGTGIHDKSPWDVPSSPEFEVPSKRLMKQDSTSHTRTKITRGLRRQLDDIGYVSQEDEPPQPVATQSRKKRKVERDLVVSTAPIESDPSFMVAPTTLTASQKEQYSSLKTGIMSSPAKALERRCANVLSSGTATNLNTPRTNDDCSLEPLSQLKGRSKAKHEPRDNSPNNAAPTPPKEPSPKRKADGKAAKKKKVIVASDEESDEGHGYAPGEVEHDDESDFERTTKPIEKKKRPRGRPKKTDAPTKEDKGSVTKVAKKRGRPKKVETVVVLDDEDDEVQKSPPVISDPVSTELRVEQQPDTKVNQAEDSILTSAKTEDAAADETSLNQSPQSSTLDTKGDACTTLSKKTDEKASAAPTAKPGRPLYRVGLSKRTRIAPLLKVIRK